MVLKEIYSPEADSLITNNKTKIINLDIPLKFYR